MEAGRKIKAVILTLMIAMIIVTVITYFIGWFSEFKVHGYAFFFVLYELLLASAYSSVET